MQQKGEYVYLRDKKGKLTVVENTLEKPNGIIGTPDGKILYIADIKANKTYKYQIDKDGTLKNKRLFAALGSDGMTQDIDGNIYLTGKGVTVFNKEGKQIAHIPVKGWTANVCFGGKDMKTLFITANKNLYTIKMNIEGER